jgi:predicted Rossmann fold nucleotide-binding protein DprA/Smf involved in DNA uptake
MDMLPGDLFEEQNQRRLSDAGVICAEQVIALLDRGLVLAMALEKWTSQGMWVIGWSDPEYPVKYKERLKGQAPPILYGIGDKALLSTGGLAIVGSRDVDEQAITFARKAANSCAAHGTQVVSGGARGVDSEAMLACLDSGGHAVGVLSDSLARRAVSERFRDAVISGALVLVSPFEPEARFFVANAMARNKLIYTLADFALVINSDYKKGGTWAGATEDIDKGWVPLFVRKDSSVPAGNLRLLDAGAIAIGESSLSNNDIIGWMQREIALRGGFDPKTNSEAANSAQGTLPLI